MQYDAFSGIFYDHEPSIARSVKKAIVSLWRPSRSVNKVIYSPSVGLRCCAFHTFQRKQPLVQFLTYFERCFCHCSTTLPMTFTSQSSRPILPIPNSCIIHISSTPHLLIPPTGVSAVRNPASWQTILLRIALEREKGQAKALSFHEIRSL